MNTNEGQYNDCDPTFRSVVASVLCGGCGVEDGTVADASAMGPVMICAIAICEFIGLSWLLFGCVAVWLCVAMVAPLGH